MPSRGCYGTKATCNRGGGLMPDSLLRRVASGDQTAVEEVLDRYGGLVWSLARRYCGNLTDAEDAAQEVFVDVWRSAGRFDDAVAGEATFIAMIARRRLIDRSRTSARRPEAGQLPAELTAADVDQAQLAEFGDDVARAASALAALRPEQQQVLRLSIFDGLSHDQIAKTTGLPLGTVKTHARRGLLRMRELVARGDFQTAREGLA
jgi:RNA polymerase sigma-70 factor, ECF subfamily